MSEIAIYHDETFGLNAGDIVQEWLWDDDVDETIRERIASITGEDLVDEDYDEEVDAVIVWWRDGDDEDALYDTIVDACALLKDQGPFWVIFPKPGRPGAPMSRTLADAAKSAGMNALTPISVTTDWSALQLRAFGQGKPQDK